MSVRDFVIRMAFIATELNIFFSLSHTSPYNVDVLSIPRPFPYKDTLEFVPIPGLFVQGNVGLYRSTKGMFIEELKVPHSKAPILFPSAVGL